MRDVYDRTSIQAGSEVYGSDNEHIGTVDEAFDSYLLIQKGLFFPKDIYVPFSAITQADADRVVLNVTKDQIDSMGWNEPPSGTSSGAATDWSGSTAASTRTSQDDLGTERDRLELHEEELEARKTARKTGEVEVSKRVVEEEQAFDVPVAREEVRVRRVPADRDAEPGSTSFSDEGDTIRVPVMEEEVDVTKRPVVREEIEVEKVVHQDTKRVADTVRREEADVHGDVETLDADDEGVDRLT